MRVFELRHDSTIQTVHSYNGGEYDPFSNLSAKLGIVVKLSAPYTTHSNKIFESQNCSIF